ncbi:MAG: dihydroneopterin aldolase [Tannerellaceae bacterium]|jgi:dihydroneopterin aldolase|nr:dihydroneopterin aldolase [Tannerellaceae bacterium]
MISKIVLKDMKFYAYHGILPQEKCVGNNFLVNLSVTAPLEAALHTDDLNDTINYATVYSLVKKEMDIPSCLIEHVAGRILRSLKNHFPRITETELSLSKLNPPITGDIHSATIVLREVYTISPR